MESVLVNYNIFFTESIHGWGPKYIERKVLMYGKGDERMVFTKPLLLLD